VLLPAAYAAITFSPLRVAAIAVDFPAAFADMPLSLSSSPRHAAIFRALLL